MTNRHGGLSGIFCLDCLTMPFSAVQIRIFFCFVFGCLFYEAHTICLTSRAISLLLSLVKFHNDTERPIFLLPSYYTICIHIYGFHAANSLLFFSSFFFYLIRKNSAVLVWNFLRNSRNFFNSDELFRFDMMHDHEHLVCTLYSQLFEIS